MDLEPYRKSVMCHLSSVTTTKITATKLYEALLMLTDISEALETSQDDILTILSDTNWDQDIETLKPVRNQLRQLFIPSSTHSATIEFCKNKRKSKFQFNINSVEYILRIEFITGRCSPTQTHIEPAGNGASKALSSAL